MKISTKGRYSLRAMIDLSCFGANEPVRLVDMSKRTKISRNYLVKLFQELKKAGLVKSVQGRFGGFVLSKPALNITVKEILQASDEAIVPVSCLKCYNNENKTCEMLSECAASDFWNDLALHIDKFLEKTTLHDLYILAKNKKAGDAITLS